MFRRLSYGKSEIQCHIDNIIKSTSQQRKAMKKKSSDNNLERAILKA